MKRNNLILLAILLALVLAFVFLFNNDKGKDAGVDLGDRNFAVENQDDIQTIVLQRKNYPRLVFRKKSDGYFMINDRYEASEYTMPHIIKVLSRLKLQYIPPKAATENIVKDMEKNGILVEVFDKDDNKIRSYTVGSETADGRGTHYLMTGSNQPYVMGGLASEGSLRVPLMYSIEQMRSKIIFREDPKKIARVDLQFPRSPEQGYSIIKSEGKIWMEQEQLVGKPKKIENINPRTVESFFEAFSKVVAEASENENPEKEFILTQPHFLELVVHRKDGSQKGIKLISVLDIMDKSYDVEDLREVDNDFRYFVVTSDGELYLTQHRIIQQILFQAKYFQS